MSKRVRVKKSEAHKKYGRYKTVAVEILEPKNRKVVVSYSLPLWQVEWIEDEAASARMHRSTFLAGLIEAGRSGLEAGRIANAEIEASGREEDEED